MLGVSGSVASFVVTGLHVIMDQVVEKPASVNPLQAAL